MTNTARRATHEREDRVLADLCEQLEHREGVEVRVVSRPDRDERRKEAVDAVLQRGQVQWAVEHTRVFDRRDQLGLHKRLDPVRHIIVRAVRAAFPGERVGVAVPVEELPAGRDRALAAKLLADAVIAMLPEVPEGKGMLIEVPGFTTSPGVIHHLSGYGEGGCLVVPRVPENDDDLRVSEMIRAMADKRAKVEAMRARGFRTMLVLDSAEMLWGAPLFVAFEKAATPERVCPYDEIYMAMSGWEPTAFEMLKSGDRWPLDQPEHEQFVDLWIRACEKRRAERRPVR